MSCELRTLISVFILSAISLKLNCRSFSGTSEREAAGYSGASGFSEVFYNFTSQLQISAFEFNEANPNSNRIRRSIKLDSSAETPDRNRNENPPKLFSKHMYEFSPIDNENTRLKRAFDVEAGFQGDAPAFGGRAMAGKIYTSQSGSSSKSRDMWLALHKVRCSEEVMTLTTAGREYTHIYVDRVDAAPLPLLQVPSYCGFSVSVTWKDLVLRLPYDGCFITKENDSYVLPLVWWGSPIKISCPVTPVISAPSVFCSEFAMVIAIKGAQEAAEKHLVKVNVRMLPLLSDTCAYRLRSPPEIVLLHTAFNAGCVTSTDDQNILVIILDGKQFTVSCPVPHHLSQFRPYLQSPLFHQPLQPGQEQMPLIPHVPAAPVSSETSKPAVIYNLPYEQPDLSQFYNQVKHPQYPFHQIPSVYQHQKPPGQFYPMFPHHPPLPPADTPPKPPIQQKPPPPPLDQIPQVPHYPMMPPPYYSPYPISCPPFPEEFCSQFPMPDRPPIYHEPSTDSQTTIPPVPWTSFPQPTYKPQTPPIMQEAVFSQFPIFPPAPPAQPSKISPLLHCARNRLTATLPSATMDSIKVRDVRTNSWISIALASKACNYNLYSRGGSVVLSSPLPSCHTKQTSPTVISLLVRFWDSSQDRHRTLQLQCHFTGDTSIQPKDPPIPVKPLHQAIPNLTDAPARTPPYFQVLCSGQHMSVKLPPGPTSGLFVQAPSSDIHTEATLILEAPSHCGYSVKMGKDGAINVLLPYSSCHMTQMDGEYRIILKYQTPRGRTVESLLSCQASLSQECSIASEQRLVCGSRLLSSSECHDRGCCYCGDTQMCYYPMDECTMDRHFVFSVRSSTMDPPLSPATLVTAGKSSCKPERVTDEFAIFKIPLDKCGVHRYEVGKTVIYMVEILNRVQPVSLNYGTITRDSAVRLIVECRYLPGSVVSVGYLVKSPSLGPSIKAQGVFGIQLRIAKDEHYNNFYPQYHQPLQMLLGKPLYLEVRLLNPPDPTTMLLVHYCVAYPRSANSAWILIYDGCPNFLDQTPTHKPPATPAEALTNHVRRFTITTFQFLSEDASLQADEEIYFMCSTEVCLPSDGPCVEGCFGDPSNVKS